MECMNSKVENSNMESMNAQNKNAIDFASFRKYMDQAPYECTSSVRDLDYLSEDRKTDIVNEQNAIKTVRWYKAWRDCEFTDEMVAKLLKANMLLEEKIAEMFHAAYKLAKWERRRLNKIGKPYAEAIDASLQVCYVEFSEDYEEPYYNMFNHETKAISQFRITLRDDEQIGYEPMSHHYNVPDIPESEICEPARAFDSFLSKSRETYAVAFQISELRLALNLPEKIGTKWERFFERLDKFQDNLFCLPMLAMIGRFKLAPRDVCAICDYQYKLNITHFSDTTVPCLFMSCY